MSAKCTKCGVDVGCGCNLKGGLCVTCRPKTPPPPPKPIEDVNHPKTY